VRDAKIKRLTEANKGNEGNEGLSSGEEPVLDWCEFQVLTAVVHRGDVVWMPSSTPHPPVSLFQSLRNLWGGQPGPALVQLASAQAITLVAFSPGKEAPGQRR
jgi:hypothetical protein